MVAITCSKMMGGVTSVTLISTYHSTAPKTGDVLGYVEGEVDVVAQED